MIRPAKPVQIDDCLVGQRFQVLNLRSSIHTFPQSSLQQDLHLSDRLELDRGIDGSVSQFLFPFIAARKKLASQCFQNQIRQSFDRVKPNRIVVMIVA